MKIQSKIGSFMLILTIFVLLCTLATFIVWAVTGNYVPTIIFVCMSVLFLLPTYTNTNYEIKNGRLYINFGWFLIRYAIPCYNIISMTDAHSVTISPALSSERLRITYIKNDKIKSIYISPTNKELFRSTIQQTIDQHKVQANFLHTQVDQTTLQNVIAKEQQKQAKMDSKEQIEQQKQEQQDLRENSREVRRLEKRAQQAKIEEYKNEQKQAIKDATEQLNATLAKQDDKTNMQRKQLSRLIAMHDEQEKRERKQENEKWERERREKRRREKEQKKLDRQQKKEQQKLARQIQKHINDLEE